MDVVCVTNSRFSCDIIIFHAKLKITFPSAVSVSSDNRPYKTLAFHNVLARQGSSFVTEHVVTEHFHGPRRLSRRSKDDLSL